MSYIERMIEEFDELDGRIERLTDFVTSDTFNSLEDVAQRLLFSQMDAMSTYRDILGIRRALVTHGLS